MSAHTDRPQLVDFSKAGEGVMTYRGLRGECYEGG